MASPNAHLVNKLQLSYETSVKRRSLHPFGKNKAKTRLFSKAGPAFKGFHYDEVYDVHHFRLVSLIESDENDEKLLEKKLLTIHGLSCDRCTLAFSSKNHLEKHTFFCGNPNVVAGDLKLLKKCKGFLQEEDGGMLFCPWCPILSSNMVALLKHVRSCREARRERCERKVLKRLPCPECAIEFSHLQKLSNHMQSHYVADFTCNACKSSFSTANNLAKHLGECKSKQPYRCCDCNIYFRNIKPLQKHVLTCRTSVQCLKCAEIFPGKHLCVEHVVMHIFSEWSNIGLQMIDGVLYKILRHKLPQEDFLKPTLSRSPSPTISPCASPVQDPVKSQEKPGYASISIAGRPNPQLEKNFASSKALSSMDKSLPLLGSVKDLKTSDNFPAVSSSHKSVPILTSDQRLGKNVAESGSIVKSIRTLKPVIRNCDPLHSAATDMLLANDDNLSAVIENDAFEIEDTLEDDFSIESEMCDSEPPLLPSEAGNSSKKFVETTIGPHHNHDVAKLFTPAIDIESGDSSELTLTVVNVEGGANLFNWDDCDTEEVGEIGDQQVDTYDPAEICNDMHLGAYSHHDANEDGDSGIGATDDSDSNKDKSEVSLKGDDKISNHSEMPPKLSIVPEKAVESSCSPVLPEVMLSAPSCDSEIVVESSPINQMEGMRSYSVMAEHSYSLGVSDAMQNINKQGKTSKVHSSERQGVEKKSQKVRNKKINEDGKSRQAVRKKCSKQLINENSRTADTSLTELDPLQRILEVMSKEARQTATKKPKSVKPSSVPKTASTPSEHPQLIGNTSAAFKEYLSSDENVLSEPGTIASANNVIPIQEEFSVSDHSSSHPTDSASQPIITSNFFQPIESITAPCEEQSYNETNVFSESGAFSFQNDVSSVVQADSVSDFALSHPPQAAASMFSNGSVEETKSSEKHFMEQEDTETHPEVPETISNLPPSEYISQKTLSQDEFIEKVKPAMSRNKTLQKERSMLRHGFKQIATVLPQRKEHHLMNEAFSPNYCSKMPSLHVNLSTQTQKSAFAAVKATKPISNIIYIQLPPGVTPRCPEIPTTSNNVILAKLVPSTPISSTANRSSFSQNPLHFALQGPEHPRDVVSALVELGSDLVSQQNSVANEVNYSSVLLPPLSAISAGPASTFVENILEEAEGLPLRLGTGAHSGTESCPEVESEAISNHSSAVNEILNAPALPTCSSQSQEVVCSEEIVPRMPTKENGNELKRDSSMLRKSKPSERKFIKLGSLCNTITNLEEKVPLIKSGLNVTILPHAGDFSLPVFHSLDAEETVLSEGNLPPIKEISHTPPNNAEEDLRNESAMLKSKQLDSSHLKKEALGLNRMKNVPLLTHNSAAANLFDASDIVPLQNSTLNPQFSEQTVCSKENLPPVEEAPHMHYLNEPKKDLKMESTMLPKSKQSEIKNFKLDNRDDCRINYEESSALLQSKYLIKSSAKQLGTKNESEAVLVKLVGESLPETTNCKIVEENEKQAKAEDTSKMTVPENPEKDFENDISECVDSTLDHEIKALISCLDSNIASEETRDSADSSGQFFRQKDSVKEKLVSPLPKHDTVQTLNDTTKEKDSTKKFNLVLQKSFKVCQMQLCSSSNEDELLLNTFTTGENSKEDSGLLKINDDCVSTHKMRTRISQFRTNLYVSRKLMSEMKCFKRNKFGREGVHRSENVSTYNCNCCSQWFYSEVSLRSHTCLKAIIREKFNSEQFDELIARVEKTVPAQELVQLNNQVEGQQTECAQNLGHVNEESGADESTSNSATTQMSPYLSYLQMKTNVRHKKFICDKCNVRCKSFSALLEHKSSVHDEKYSVECHICGKKFSRLQQLAVHVAKSHKVTNPSMKRPVQSVKTNLLKSNLSRKTVVRLIKRRLERSGLSKAVPRVNNQISREKTLHLAENCTAQGNVSKDDFNTALGELLVDGTAQKGKNVNSEQWQEENLVITGISHPDSLDKSSQCSICNKRFKGKIGLTSHMVQAHRENQSTSAEDDITECSICKKLFKGKNGLTSHINQAHRETFKCPLCLRRFCYIQTLKFHLANQHSSSLNTDALPPESVEPEGMMQLPSSESVEVPVQENGGSSDLSDKSSLGTLDAKDCDGQMPSANVSKSDLKKPTITKWKFVQEFSPEKIHEPPAEESVNVEDYVSSKERITKKVKKIKWRIVKDTSPEKIPPSERPAKSPRLSDGNIEPVPPLVIAFSKVKKHRHKCRICRKHFKKHYHLLQHQMVAHKFRSQLQLERHVEQCQSENKNEKLSTSTLVENQQSITPATLSNCLPNVIIGEIDLCSADKKPGENGSELGNPEKVQCSSANIATVNTGSSAVESTPSVNVEKSPQEETVLSAPDEKPQEENSASDSASIMLPKEKLQNAPNGKFECEICQIEFSAKGYFERHNIKIHGAPCKFSCPLCDKIFTDRRSLRFHTKTKHRESDGSNTSLSLQSKCKSAKERKCEQCNKKFRKYDDLRNHTRKVHKIHRYKCCSCSLSFKTEVLLAAHKVNSHSKGSEEKNCDSSTSPNKSYDDAKMVNLSVQSVNEERMTEFEKKSEDLQENSESLKCSDCSLTYKLVSCLKRHRILMHGEQATHQCDVCGKGFSYPHSLKTHMLTHSRNEPPRTSRRLSRRKGLPADLQVPGPNLVETEVKQGNSTSSVLENESIPPNILSSEITRGSEVSGDKEMEENISKSGIVDKQKQDQDIRSNTSNDDDSPHCRTDSPLPLGNTSQQEDGPSVFSKHIASDVSFNTLSPPNCTVPEENYSMNYSCAMNDALIESPDPVKPDTHVSDPQWSSTPEPQQYQMPPMAPFSAPLAPLPSVTPSFDQIQAFNTCTLCGLCVPSWQALQEHYYVFHSYQNYYAAAPTPSPYAAAPPMPYAATPSPMPYPAPPTPMPYPAPPTPMSYASPSTPSPYAAPPTPMAYAAPPSPMPYAASLGYPTFQNENPSYGNWTVQQPQFTNISQSTVLHNGASSFQELSSQSGVHCSLCGLVFPSLCALQAHYSTHMAVSKPTVQHCSGFY